MTKPLNTNTPICPSLLHASQQQQAMSLSSHYGGAAATAAEQQALRVTHLGHLRNILQEALDLLDDEDF